MTTQLQRLQGRTARPLRGRGAAWRDARRDGLAGRSCGGRAVMLALAGLLGLAGCTPGGMGAGAVTEGAGLARGGVQPVSLEGLDYAVTLGARGFGRAIGGEAVVPVSGREVRVQRLAAPMRLDEGAAAKKAARRGCAAAGGRFNERALSRFDRAGGAWVFEGGCA